MESSHEESESLKMVHLMALSLHCDHHPQRPLDADRRAVRHITAADQPIPECKSARAATKPRRIRRPVVATMMPKIGCAACSMTASTIPIPRSAIGRMFSA